MVRTPRRPASPGSAALFGLFVGAFAAVLVGIGAASAGFPPTPLRVAGYAVLGLALAYVAARGLLLV